MMSTLQGVMSKIENDVQNDDNLNNLKESDFDISDPILNQIMSGGVENMMETIKSGNLEGMRSIMQNINPEKLLGGMPGLTEKLGSVLGKSKKNEKEYEDVPLTDEQLKELEEYYKKLELIQNEDATKTDMNENFLQIESVD